MHKVLTTLAALLVSAGAAQGQTLLYETAFDDGAGWTGVNTGSSCNWATDASPALVGPGGFRSAPSSLNCNNTLGGGFDGCFDNTADSPMINLSPAAATGAVLEFWCAYDLEESDCSIEARHVQVSSDGFANLLLDVCLLWEDCGGSSSEPWHVHKIPLDPAWGSVQVRFFFDSFDLLFENFLYDGWYVDDMSIALDCAPSVPYCTAKTNSQGCSPAIFSTGTPSASGAGNSFRVQATNVLSQHPGILIWSLTGASTPFGGGTLCLGSPVQRTPGQSSGGNGGPLDCSGSYSYQFTPGYLAANGLLPGTAVFTQYWSRDTGFGAPDNVGLSAGLRFAVCD